MEHLKQTKNNYGDIEIIKSKPDAGAGDGAVEKAGRGEGSRGGTVIGHTKSGKPVYNHDHHTYWNASGGAMTHSSRSEFKEDHKGWSAQDHEDAARIHDEEARAGKQLARPGSRASASANIAQVHRDAAKGAFGDLRKSMKGEGTRGGHVIGHTKSGKPIYSHDPIVRNSYWEWTDRDHSDAADAHEKAAERARLARDVSYRFYEDRAKPHAEHAQTIRDLHDKAIHHTLRAKNHRNWACDARLDRYNAHPAGKTGRNKG